MANTVKPIDYTVKDYESFRHAMMEIKKIKLPEWTSESQSDPGIVIIELIAHALDILSFYQDRNANEAYFRTAKLRRSIIELAYLIGYELSNATPSRVGVQFTFASPLSSDLVIPKGFQVGTRRTPTEESIIFEVAESVTIPAGTKETDGEIVPHVDCVQGFSVYNEVLGSGTETPDQSFVLSKAPVIVDDSLVIWVREGTVWNPWTRVDDFIYGEPTDRFYTIFTDEVGVVTVTFGNGVHGSTVPKGSNNVRADYRVGGGAVGNVGANTITRVISSGITGISSINNPEEPYLKGIDAESIENAKRVAPKSFRSRDTLVTLLDHEDFAEIYEGVERAQAVLDENRNVILYVKPNGGGQPTQTLLDRLEADMETRRILTVDVTLLGPTYIDVDVEVSLYIYDNFEGTVVSSRVREAVLEYLGTREFNQNVLLGELYRVVMSIEGVSNAVLYSKGSTPFTDILIGEGEIAIPGEVTVSLA